VCVVCFVCVCDRANIRRKDQRAYRALGDKTNSLSLSLSLSLTHTHILQSASYRALGDSFRRIVAPVCLFVCVVWFVCMCLFVCVVCFVCAIARTHDRTLIVKCVFVCVCERERERERECVCVLKTCVC